MISCPKCKKAGRSDRLAITGLMRESTGYPHKIEAEVLCACGNRMWTTSMSVKRHAVHVDGARIVTRAERIAQRRKP